MKELVFCAGFLSNGVPGETSAPAPFSRGQEGAIETGINRAGPPLNRDGFVPGGRGPSPNFSRKPQVPPAVLERRRISADSRLRQQASQLRISSDLVPERLNDKYELRLKAGATDKVSAAAELVQIANAYMYSAIHSEQPSAVMAAGRGVDRAGFDAAVELYQRPQAAQWTRPSKHGHFILTSVQIMTNV